IIEITYAEQFSQGDFLEIDLENGLIINHTNGHRYDFIKYPDFLQQIIKSGGLISWVKEKYTK
ncbi:MAG TPA: 3-isopropylmalate dehydratase, partial [bacterium]|nr:3-isopropylmalate dehydratase [bacterium]